MVRHGRHGTGAADGDDGQGNHGDGQALEQEIGSPVDPDTILRRDIDMTFMQGEEAARIPLPPVMQLYQVVDKIGIFVIWAFATVVIP